MSAENTITNEEQIADSAVGGALARNLGTYRYSEGEWIPNEDRLKLAREIKPVALDVFKSVKSFYSLENKAREKAARSLETNNISDSVLAIIAAKYFEHQKFMHQYMLRKLGADPSDQSLWNDENINKAKDFLKIIIETPQLIDPKLDEDFMHRLDRDEDEDPLMNYFFQETYGRSRTG